MARIRTFLPETRTHRWSREELQPEGYLAHYVYRMRDSAGVLLYIGVTGNPRERGRQHAQRKSWWKDVATIEATEYAHEYLALDAERIAIRAEAPLYNIRSAAVWSIA